MNKLKTLLLAVTVILIIENVKSIPRHFAKHKSEENNVKEDDNYFREDNDAPLTPEDLPENDQLFEGDMIMDDDLRNAVLAGNSDKRSVVADAELFGRRHWKNGIVPYVLDPSLAPIIRYRIRQAIRNFNKFTCVRFIPKRVRDKDYIRFTNARGCSSNVGRKGGEQLIHLGYYCKRIGTVMHEMMHALGIIHEQSRYDRDKYVKILFRNIKRKHAGNFRKYTYGLSHNLKLPYNYWSVMHYSGHAFSMNGRPTIISTMYPSLRFGQRKMVSRLDVKEVNLLYKCLPIHSNKRELHEDMTPQQVLQLKRRDQMHYYDDHDNAENL